jgi:tetratricopeptide (TPR) repeat protein
MSVQDHRCARCSNPLALVDSVCPHCGEPVPVASRLAILGARAETLAESGQFAEAARAADAVTALELEPAEAKLWFRKKGAWLQRSGRPDSLAAAERALAEVVRLDDADDLAHQLWMDLLHRTGQLDKARNLYKGRLQRDPEDAVAKRHLAALRLMQDMQLAPSAGMKMPKFEDGFMMKMLRPTTMKMVTVGSGILFCVAMLIYGLVAPPEAAPAAVALPVGSDEAMIKLAGGGGPSSLGDLMKMAADPWSNLIQIVLYGAYLFWGWRLRKRGR